MLDTFWLIKFENILIRMWYNPALFSPNKPHNFLLFCHGFPSHPYDENPATNQRFMRDGFVLVYPEYIGTLGSDGQCNFENCVDTVLKTVELLMRGTSNDIKSSKAINWTVNQIVLIGGSFGGSVVLVAGAKSHHIKKIVAASPVLDWRTHNQLDYEEEDLVRTWQVIEDGLHNYWRVKKEDFIKLMNGELDLSPIDYVDILKDKDIFLIHGIYDTQVNYRNSKNISQTLKKGTGNHVAYFPHYKGHIVTRHLSQPSFYKKIINWL